MTTSPAAMEPIRTGTVSPVSTISSTVATTCSAPSLPSTTPSSPVSGTDNLDSATLAPSQDAFTLKRKSPSDEDEDSAPTSTHPPKRRSSEWRRFAAQFQEFPPEIPHGTTTFTPFTDEQDAAIPSPAFQADAYPKQELDDIIMSDDEAPPKKKVVHKSLHPFTERTLTHYKKLLATTKWHIKNFRKMPKKDQHGRLEGALEKQKWLEDQIADPPPPPPIVRWRHEKKIEDKKNSKLRKFPPYSTAEDGLIRDKLPAKIRSIFFNFLQARKAERTYSNETAYRDLSILFTKLQASRKALGKKYNPRNEAQPTLDELDALQAGIENCMDDIKSCMSNLNNSRATHNIEPLRAGGIDNGTNLVLKFSTKFRLDRTAATLGCAMLTAHECEQFHVPYATHNLWIAHLQLCESLDTFEQALKAAKAPRGRPVPEPKVQVLRLDEDRGMKEEDLPWVYWEQVSKAVDVDPEILAIDAASGYRLTPKEREEEREWKVRGWGLKEWLDSV